MNKRRDDTTNQTTETLRKTENIEIDRLTQGGTYNIVDSFKHYMDDRVHFAVINYFRA